MSHRLRLVLSTLVLVVTTSGCIKQTLFVTRADPSPNVALVQSKARLALRIEPDVPDTYVHPRTSGIGPTDVKQWHETLQAGFEQGIAPSFAAPGAGADFVLVLKKAELAMVPAAVSGDGYVVSGRAQVRFQAQLLDATGQPVRAVSGTVESKTSSSRMEDATLLAGDAVEGMYEEIAAKLLQDLPAQSAPAPGEKDV